MGPSGIGKKSPTVREELTSVRSRMVKIGKSKAGSPQVACRPPWNASCRPVYKDPKPMDFFSAREVKAEVISRSLEHHPLWNAANSSSVTPAYADLCISDLIETVNWLRRQREMIRGQLSTRRYFKQEAEFIALFVRCSYYRTEAEVEQASLRVLRHLREDYRFTTNHRDLISQPLFKRIAWHTLVVIECIIDRCLSSSTGNRDYRHQVEECLCQIVHLEETNCEQGTRQPFLLRMACRYGSLRLPLYMERIRMVLNAGADPNRHYCDDCMYVPYESSVLGIICDGTQHKLSHGVTLLIANVLVRAGANPAALLPDHPEWHAAITRHSGGCHSVSSLRDLAVHAVRTQRRLPLIRRRLTPRDLPPSLLDLVFSAVNLQYLTSDF